ncbi:MAG: GTPase/DUF3482 domain-containing protein [Pseudomonadales bacterium]
MSGAETVPRFAVIGHPNKGKSSIVATLAEDDSIRVSPVPGTTQQARRFGFSIDGRALYQLVDTPGFQRARELLNWLEQHDSAASERSALVAEFVQQHRDDPRFHDECELLKPLLEGAGILYVVDGAKPYGAEYELEMEVLRWTGRPRMALINLIGEGDYVDEWRAALGQYFSIVRVFDAVHADFDKRLDLLRGFAELDEHWKPQLNEAVSVLLAERARRVQRSAEEIAAMLSELLVAQATKPIAMEAEEDAVARDALQQTLTEHLKRQIRQRERTCRRAVAQIYRHFQVNEDPDAEGDGTPSTSGALLASELFAQESWRLFGLSRQQLLVTGALSGAVAGSGVDLLLGGASLLLGAGIGAAIGGASAWIGGDELAKVKVLGQRLGGKVMQVGPVREPNFPWVLLGRAWLHHKLISERNHARREALAMDASLASHHMDGLPRDIKRPLARLFAKLRADADSVVHQAELTALVSSILAAEVQLDATVQ